MYLRTGSMPEVLVFSINYIKLNYATKTSVNSLGQ
jgi:hypothetical protein